MKRLRIGIDINEANVARRVGTGQYTYHILKDWYKHEDIEFHLYHRDELQRDLPPAGSSWVYHRVGPSRAWIRFGLPLYLVTHPKNDIFWSPAHYMPSYTGCPSVVTVHDLAYEYFPDLFLRSDLYKLKNWTRSSIKQASRVIAVSEATRNDLVKLYGLEPGKVSVVYNGYDSDIFNDSPKISPSLLANWDLEIENYILFLGTIQPRKNAITLIKAFELLKNQGYLGKLVIAGNIGWMADETLKAVETSPVKQDIVLTGYVSDEVRKTFYTYADVYVLPSLYEGFGVPAIEAMACGAPVVAARNSSLIEVVQDAGILFETMDPQSLLDSIIKIKQDRKSWITRSLARAKDFSWKQTAQETLKVLTSGKIG